MSSEQAVYAIVLRRDLAGLYDLRIILPRLSYPARIKTVGELVNAVVQRIYKEVVAAEVYNAPPTEQTLAELEISGHGTFSRRGPYLLDRETPVADEHRGESGENNPYFVVLTFASAEPGAPAAGTAA